MAIGIEATAPSATLRCILANAGIPGSPHTSEDVVAPPPGLSLQENIHDERLGSGIRQAVPVDPESGHEQVVEKATKAARALNSCNFKTLDNLIRSRSRSGDVEAVERAINQMHELGMAVPVGTLNSVVHAYTKAGHLEKAKQYILSMEEKGLPCNVLTYNAAINVAALAQDPASAAYWWQRMLARGLEPTTVTYGTLCKVLAHAGQPARVQDIMNNFVAQGGQLTEHFYASLIIACGTSEPKDLPRAKLALCELVEAGLQPNRVRRAFTFAFGRETTDKTFKRCIPR